MPIGALASVPWWPTIATAAPTKNAAAVRAMCPKLFTVVRANFNVGKAQSYYWLMADDGTPCEFATREYHELNPGDQVTIDWYNCSVVKT